MLIFLNSFMKAIAIDPVSQIEGGSGSRVLDLLWSGPTSTYIDAFDNICLQHATTTEVRKNHVHAA